MGWGEWELEAPPVLGRKIGMVDGPQLGNVGQLLCRCCVMRCAARFMLPLGTPASANMRCCCMSLCRPSFMSQADGSVGLETKSRAQRATSQHTHIPGMVKPNCFGVMAVSTSEVAGVAGRAGAAAACTRSDTPERRRLRLHGRATAAWTQQAVEGTQQQAQGLVSLLSR
jgi:hypothetical protein